MTISKNLCADCVRENNPNPRPKEYNSYCKTHAYARQRRSKKVKSARRELIYGFWWQIKAKSAGTITNNLNEYIRIPKLRSNTTTDYIQWVRSVQEYFEYTCVHRATALGKQLTLQEEAVIVEEFHGSADGVPCDTLIFEALRATENELPKSLINVPLMRLPDERYRLKFRADGHGGPTTLGEPTLLEYYRAQYGSVPADIRKTYEELANKDAASGTIYTLETYNPEDATKAPVVAMLSEGAVRTCVLDAYRGARTQIGSDILGEPLNEQRSTELEALVKIMYAEDPWADDAGFDAKVISKILIRAQDERIFQVPVRIHMTGRTREEEGGTIDDFVRSVNAASPLPPADTNPTENLED